MAPFDVQISSDGPVTMRLVGSLDSANLEVLTRQVEDAKRAVRAESERRGVQLPILFDLSEFTGTYNVESMLAMKGLEEHNRPFVEKTAIFGGSPAARVAADLTLALIHKDNLKLFPTKEEAEAWLKT